MEITKKIDFDEMAEILKVLGHPVRLKIVCGLITQNACVTDIHSCLGLPQATVSQHLSLLKNKKIVKSTRDGVRMQYQVIDEDVIRFVKALLQC